MSCKRGLRKADPYRATLVWNSIVRQFHERVSNKNHIKKLKVVKNCFKAKDAIGCLHKILLENDKTPAVISRNQAMRLLGKFLKLHVIEDIKGNWGKEEMKDDNRLYRYNGGPFADCTYHGYQDLEI